MNAFLKNNFPKLTTAELARIDQLYPESGTYPDAGPYWRTAANAYGDMRYMCPAIWLSTVYDEHRAQGYLYHWDVASESNIESGYGSTHCDEMNSIWGVAAEEPEVSLNPIIQAYWTSFVRAGNPNTYKLANAPTWEKCNSTGLQRIHFVNDTSQIAMENVPADIYSRCNVLTNMGGPLGQ
jgi:carboxylesterase type B